MAGENNMRVEADGPAKLAAFAVDMGKKAAGLVPVELVRNINAAQVALVPDGMHLEDIKEHLPAYPDRKREKMQLLDVKSFIAYVNRMKLDNQTIIMAQIEADPVTFTAIIDHHEPSVVTDELKMADGQEPEKREGVAGWCDQQVILTLKRSREFATWMGINGKHLKQIDFVEFLKDNRFDIADPSGADILQICMALEATCESRFVGKTPTNEGVKISFEEKTRTNLDVPNKITLRLPLFAGMAPVDVAAEFKFKPDGGLMYFGIRLLGIEKALRQAVDDARAEIASMTGVQVLF